MKDLQGDRMKSNYEDRTRYLLPRRTYTILRVDGKAFHSYTRGCIKPFDPTITLAMDETAKYLCENIQGAKFGYVQSDEISILLTDFEKDETSAYFDGNIQKIVSITASMAAAKFNSVRFNPNKLAVFDCRAYTIPDWIEVYNYFDWRNKDCIRNAINMVAQVNLGHKAIQSKNILMVKEMLATQDVNIETDYDQGNMMGRLIRRDVVKVVNKDKTFDRAYWKVIPAWKFGIEPSILQGLIPLHS